MVVTRVGAEVDPLSQSVKVFGEFQEPQNDLIPGMSGRAKFNPE